MGDGFPDGARWTPLPDLFFSRYAVQMTDASTLKVALHVLWRVYRRTPGAPPALREADLVGDATLRRGLAAMGVESGSAAEIVTGALDRLVTDGLLLEATVPADGGPARWFFVNGREGRGAYARWQADGLVLPSGPAAAAGGTEARPSVFALYEQNIGLLTPMLADELRDAESSYPGDWIEDAIRLAVENNARKWAYVRAILERWASEGRDHEADRRGAVQDRERDSEGPYADYVER